MMEHKEYFDQVCEPKLKDIAKAQAETHAKVDKIYDKLFVDNGTPCVTTRLDRLERSFSFVKNSTFVIYTAIVGVIAWIIKGIFI